MTALTPRERDVYRAIERHQRVWSEPQSEWMLGNNVPRGVAADFDVWLTDRSVRHVRHVDSVMGVLHFMDCTHLLQNVNCDDLRVQGWRIRNDMERAL